MPLLFAILLLLGAVARFLPHPANFAPIGALGIFAGLYAKNWKQGIALPLTARLISDALIGFFSPGVMASVYLATLFGTFLGLWVKKRKTVVGIAGATVIGSVVFYILTNFAVWLFDGLYPMNLQGLIESYTMALPFFRNSLLGDVFYTGVLVGSYELFLNRKSLIISQKSNIRSLHGQN